MGKTEEQCMAAWRRSSLWRRERERTQIDNALEYLEYAIELDADGALTPAQKGTLGAVCAGLAETIDDFRVANNRHLSVVNHTDADRDG